VELLLMLALGSASISREQLTLLAPRMAVPLLNAAQNTFGGAFVAKMSPAGALVYSTYLEVLAILEMR